MLSGSTISGQQQLVMANPRRRDWCFTINNPAGPVVFQESMRYLIYQMEKGDSGTPHYQGFVQFKGQRTFNGVRTIIGQQPHLEPRMGTPQEARDYCKKSEGRLQGPFEFGTLSLGSGSRTDIIQFRDAIQGGKRKRELVADMPALMQRYAKFYLTVDYLTRPKSGPREVVLFYGATGLGKTQTVHKAWENDDYWTMPLTNGTMWFDDYDGQERVLIDDFAGKFSHVSLVNLLRLLHEYPERVPVKGGHVWWNPKLISITTNIHPNDWYDYSNRSEQRLALKRRIKKVFLFQELGTDSVLATDEWWTQSFDYFLNV